MYSVPHVIGLFYLMYFDCVKYLCAKISISKKRNVVPHNGHFPFPKVATVEKFNCNDT